MAYNSQWYLPLEVGGGRSYGIYIVMAYDSYGPYKLWPMIVVAYNSYGPRPLALLELVLGLAFRALCLLQRCRRI